MNLLLVCVVLILQGTGSFGLRNLDMGQSPGDSYTGTLPEAQWFSQRLDHFSPTDRTMWKQRYFVNDSFYDFENPGPVFLMISGESAAYSKWLVEGAWIDYAKHFKALCIYLEHRFYGESQPKEDLSVKNMAYLSSHQALADLAFFISAMKEKYKFDNQVRWVAFGGSYPGSLAAWLRLKYPHLVYAAVSSSGPLLAKPNFFEYYEVVVQALREKTGSESCVAEVKKGHEQIVALMKSQPSLVETAFSVCTPFSKANARDISNFYNWISDDFAQLVQYNEDNRIGDNDADYRNVTINSVCNIMTQPGESPSYKRLASFHHIVLTKNNKTCTDYSWNNMILQLRNTSFSAGDGPRQWLYQTCTEFGDYQSGSSVVEVFGDQFPMDFYTQQCRDVFGSKYTDAFINDAAKWTNIEYGGKDLEASRVVTVQGSLDPWHVLGLNESNYNDMPIIVINGTAHCANMYPERSDDPENLKRARLDVRQYLDDWLSLP